MTGIQEVDFEQEDTIAPEYINVHALGKFEFCERAGLLAFESRQPDDKDDWQKAPRLDYLPIFDIAKLNERLKDSTWHLTECGILILVCSVAAIIINWLVSQVIAIFLVVVTLVLVRKAFLHFRDSREISRMLELHKSAEYDQLADPNLGVRRIDWWGLTKNPEFSSSPPKKSFVSTSLNLCGKPARIAEYDRRRIPVILHLKELNEPKSYHRIRLAAYALLIEETLGGRPIQWGIVLNPTTMKGLAVPITDSWKEKAKQKISDSLLVIRDSQSGVDPRPPIIKCCQQCPFGRPRSHVNGVTETSRNGVKLPVRVNPARNGKYYHCPCGDRFKWIPPHQLAEDLGVGEWKPAGD